LRHNQPGDRSTHNSGDSDIIFSLSQPQHKSISNYPFFRTNGGIATEALPTRPVYPFSGRPFTTLNTVNPPLPNSLSTCNINSHTTNSPPLNTSDTVGISSLPGSNSNNFIMRHTSVSSNLGSMNDMLNGDTTSLFNSANSAIAASHLSNIQNESYPTSALLKSLGVDSSSASNLDSDGATCGAFSLNRVGSSGNNGSCLLNGMNRLMSDAGSTDTPSSLRATRSVLSNPVNIDNQIRHINHSTGSQASSLLSNGNSYRVHLQQLDASNTVPQFQQSSPPRQSPTIPFNIPLYSYYSNGALEANRQLQATGSLKSLSWLINPPAPESASHLRTGRIHELKSKAISGGDQFHGASYIDSELRQV
ncbi:unnamed protein product, partial [Protopolystoma xenopodis]